MYQLNLAVVIVVFFKVSNSVTMKRKEEIVRWEMNFKMIFLLFSNLFELYLLSDDSHK